MAGGAIARRGLKALGVRLDPGVSFRFSVEIEGIVVGQFTQCDGLSLEREIVSFKEGGTNDFVYQFPGRITQNKVTLKRGVTYSHDLWEWFHTGLYDGKVKRVNMSIIVGDAELKKVQHWDLLSAWPVKYEGPMLKSDTLEAALETLEVAHHGLILTSETETALGGS